MLGQVASNEKPRDYKKDIDAYESAVKSPDLKVAQNH